MKTRILRADHSRTRVSGCRPAGIRHGIRVRSHPEILVIYYTFAILCSLLWFIVLCATSVNYVRSHRYLEIPTQAD